MRCGESQPALVLFELDSGARDRSDTSTGGRVRDLLHRVIVAAEKAEPAVAGDVGDVEHPVGDPVVGALVTPGRPRPGVAKQVVVAADPLGRFEQRDAPRPRDRAVGIGPESEQQVAALGDHLGQRRDDLDGGELVRLALGPVAAQARTHRPTQLPGPEDDVVRWVVGERGDVFGRLGPE